MAKKKEKSLEINKLNPSPMDSPHIYIGNQKSIKN